MLKALSLRNFRNYGERDFLFPSRSVVIVGENGKGKTNILEAIYYSCFGAPFSGLRDRDISREKTDQFRIEAIFSGMVYDDSVVVEYEHGKKSILLNGKRIINRKEILFRNPCILFSYDDTSLALGAVETRRTFFDQVFSICLPEYLDVFQKYMKLLKMRNAYLKQEPSRDVLDSIDIQFAHVWHELVLLREKLFLPFMEKFREVAASFSEEIASIDIVYNGSCIDVDEKSLFESICADRQRDIMLKQTMKGPHRDQYVPGREQMIFAKTASVGQARLFGLIMKLVQSQLYATACSSERMIFLFDDVFIELDEKVRSVFWKMIPESNQSFFTFLPDLDFKYWINHETETIYL